MIYDILVDGASHQIEVNREGNQLLCRVDGRVFEVDAALVRPEILSLRIGSRSYEARHERTINGTQVWVGTTPFAVEVRDPRSLRGRSGAADDQGPKKLTAPMPGKVVRVLVREGDAVEAGTGLVVVEAMKMQNEIKSPKKGTVQKVLASVDAAVNAGDVLVVVE